MDIIQNILTERVKKIGREKKWNEEEKREREKTADVEQTMNTTDGLSEYGIRTGLQ